MSEFEETNKQLLMNVHEAFCEKCCQYYLIMVGMAQNELGETGIILKCPKCKVSFLLSFNIVDGKVKRQRSKSIDRIPIFGLFKETAEIRGGKEVCINCKSFISKCRYDDSITNTPMTCGCSDFTSSSPSQPRKDNE